MVTVPEAARLAHRNPETIRRWIRSGRLRARKIGTQHVIEESDLAGVTDEAGSVTMPAQWKKTWSGAPQPDWVQLIQRSRRGR